MEEVFKNGTLSIGFIGLSEAIEVLTGSKYYAKMDNYIMTLGFVKHMRDYCEFLKNEYKLSTKCNLLDFPWTGNPKLNK